MAVSKYFRHTKAYNEQELVDKLTAEAIFIRGLDVRYIPRTEQAIDYLFGEDQNSLFDTSFLIEIALPENVTGWGGEGDQMSRYAVLDLRDELNIQIHKNRFLEEVWKRDDIDLIRPREGDLIYFPMSKAVFEITFVEHEQPFYTVGQNHTFEIVTKRFQYSHEEMDTDIEEVDALETKEEYDDGVNLEIEDDGTDTGKPISDWSEEDPFSDLS